MLITIRVAEDSDGGPVNYEALVKCPVCEDKLKVFYRSYKRTYKTGLQSQGTRKWYPASFERHLVEKHSDIDKAKKSKKQKTMANFFNIKPNLEVNIENDRTNTFETVLANERTEKVVAENSAIESIPQASSQTFLTIQSDTEEEKIEKEKIDESERFYSQRKTRPTRPLNLSSDESEAANLDDFSNSLLAANPIDLISSVSGESQSGTALG